MREQGGEETISTPLPERDMCQVSKKKHMGHEFNMKTKLASYDMDGVVLDLGYDVNILPKKFLEVVSKPQLVWSPIQLWLVNQYKVYPIGRLK